MNTRIKLHNGILLLSFIIFFVLNPISNLFAQENTRYVGTWKLVSATMDGQSLNKGSETLQLKIDRWISTAGCTASGTLQFKKGKMKMVVQNHNCPGYGIPSMSQNYIVSEDGNQLTLSARFMGASFLNVYTRSSGEELDWVENNEDEEFGNIRDEGDASEPYPAEFESDWNDTGMPEPADPNATDDVPELPELDPDVDPFGDGSSDDTVENEIEETELPEPTPPEEIGEQELKQDLENELPESIEELENIDDGNSDSNSNSESTNSSEEITDTYNEIEKTPEPKPVTTEKVETETETESEVPEMNLSDENTKLPEQDTDNAEFDSDADKQLPEEGISEEELEMVDEGDLKEVPEEKSKEKKKSNKEKK